MTETAHIDEIAGADDLDYEIDDRNHQSGVSREILKTLQALLDDITLNDDGNDVNDEALNALLAQHPSLLKSTKKLRRSLANAKHRLADIRGQVNNKVTAMRRKVITGSSDKRVRDFIREVPVVKTIDKVSFTLGVLFLLLVQYMLLEHPGYFGYFYCALLVPLLLFRWHLYLKEKFQYFLLDFCYFFNLSCVICVFFPSAMSNNLIKICFVMANGPVGWAIIAWRNSLVFHSVEKLTTVYIHVLPTLVTYCWRWEPDNDLHRQALCDIDENSDPNDCSLSLSSWMTVPLGFYLAWQLFYLFLTEILCRQRFEQDSDLQTSLRWMSRSQSGMVIAVKSFVVRLGIMSREEQFDSAHWKTKWIFIMSQLLYTIVGMLPTIFFFQEKKTHTFFLILAWTICAWNGAGYYINVFSKRYIEKLEKLEAESSITRNDSMAKKSADNENLQSDSIKCIDRTSSEDHNGNLSEDTGYTDLDRSNS